MNKTKKGLITASSILTIVAASFAILTGLFCFLCASFSTEEVLVESYRADVEYDYYIDENTNEYYFMEIDDDGEMEIITQEDIQLLAKIIKVGFNVGGFVTLAFAGTKLALAIVLLAKNGKGKFAKGTAITLIVLSALSGSLIELGLLVAALCIKDKQTPQVENAEQSVNAE